MIALTSVVVVLLLLILFGVISIAVDLNAVLSKISDRGGG